MRRATSLADVSCFSVEAPLLIIAAVSFSGGTVTLQTEEDILLTSSGGTEN